MTEKQIRKQYNEIMKAYRAAGLSVVGDVLALVRIDQIEDILHQQAEHNCNCEVSERMAAWEESREQRYIAEIEEYLPKLKGMIYVNSDPRGASLKITPYIDTDDHDTRHGCDPNPVHQKMIREMGFTTDWGGYGMLAPQHNRSHQ
jgi:hypothetical protein